MNTFLRLLLVPVVFTGVGYFLHAQDAEVPRVQGKVLLLKTGHAMEGEIEKIGSQMCIRRGKSEVWIAEDKAIRLCADWEDAYAFALTQINVDDAGDRVRLARWCHTHRLAERALEQARLALELQPNNSDAKQIVTLLERAQKETPVKPALPAPKIVATPTEPAPTVDVSFETLVAFKSKVQPILTNKCASCHANGAGGNLHLERVSESGKNGASQHNLAAVLAFIDLERPAISPLLVKAITPHGGVLTPPIKDRSATALQGMQRWIEQTIAQNPQLKDYHASRKQMPPRSIPEPKGTAFPTQRSAIAAQPGDVVSRIVPRVDINEKSPPRTLPDAVTRTPNVTPVDPFDPEVFNQSARPKE